MPQAKIIQIEVTTVCQLRCNFCPRTVLADRWVNADFSWEMFSSLLPSLRRAEQVHLQGWDVQRKNDIQARADHSRKGEYFGRLSMKMNNWVSHFFEYI